MEMRSSMYATARKLIVGVEDLLGVIALGMALAGAATTWSPPPEAPPSPAFGYLATSAFLSASVLFFLAARHLHETGRFSLIRHALPIVCVLLVPLFGFLSASL